ncbi:MAG: PSD1 and planctomycete cytochrome C domain-containing protein, partial [Verrucomicrobiales bacterium]
EATTFEHDVRPILKKHCFHCHGERGKKEGGQDLRLVRFMGRVTEDGVPVVTPGRPEASVLLALVKSGRMPDADTKLDSKEIAVLERWIAEGARTQAPEPTSVPDYYVTEAERNFWSFKPIRAVEPPEVDGAASAHPIDRFVAARHAEQGVVFAPLADRRTLLRRASFDLLGLPPSPEDVAAFVADAAPEAWENAIDRLLASPHYGERWGRHWLDVAGYADSNGAVEADSPRPHAWRYRDYVVQAHNDDKPWDQFIQEQLAGDELVGLSHGDTRAAVTDPGAREKLVATGFLRLSPDGTADNPPDAKLARNQVVADTLQVLGSSLLGLSVHCAQCHDHRYDPMAQEDYFRLRALIEPVYDWKAWRAPGERLYSLYTDDDRTKAAALEAQAVEKEKKIEEWARGVLDGIFEKRVAAAAAELQGPARAIRDTPEDKRTPEQIQFLKDHPELNVGFHPGLLNVFDSAAEKEMFKMRDEVAAFRATKPPEGFVMAATEVAGAVPETLLFHRGDHDQPRQPVPPGEITVLHRPSTPELATRAAGLATSGRRLAYARWLTSGDHPLVGRVLVNRFWHHHFGRGLVTTLGDFGLLGARPTHPELLDWLAADFMKHGWRLKRLHKLILTSRTWQQSAANPIGEERDPENQWIARWGMPRMDAETVRDSLLALSGRLHPAAGGAPVPVARHGSGRIVTGEEMLNPNSEPVGVKSLGVEENRRSLYILQRRSRPLTVLDTFDLPFMSPNCEKRPVTTVSLQSLMLMNDTFVLEQAAALAERVEREAPAGRVHQIDRLWQLAYGRDPAPAESAQALAFLRENTDLGASKALASLAQVLVNSNRFLYIE